MIRNISANEVCSSGCVCFYAKNGVPCEQTLRSALLARRAKEGELAAIRLRIERTSRYDTLPWQKNFG